MLVLCAMLVLTGDQERGWQQWKGHYAEAARHAIEEKKPAEIEERWRNGASVANG
jgi:hypothetical protein